MEPKCRSKSVMKTDSQMSFIGVMNSPRTIKQRDEDQEVLMDDNVGDPNWRWPTREKWFSRLEGVWKTRDVKKPDSNEKLTDIGLKCPFEVKSLINETREDGAREVSVKLHSPHLISILRKCLPRTVETLCSEKPNLDAKDLFTIRPPLKEELKSLPEVEVEGGDGASTVARLHLQHLLRFLEEEFRDVSIKCAWMKQEGLVTYDMLWAFLTHGVEVRRVCNLSGQACHAVARAKGRYDCRRNCFRIMLDVMDYNVESYRKCAMDCSIVEFDGEVPFSSLSICPWSFFSAEECQDMAELLLHRGGLFYSYAMEKPFRFMHFEGSLHYYERNSLQLRRRNADGRVMVDLLSCARTNPDWPLGNAQPPSELLRGIEKLEEKETRKKKPPQNDLKWAPAIVYGFSLSLKQWGFFDVGGLQEIAFDDQAYEQLVMKSQKQKEMLRGIVTTHLSETGHGKRVDVIAKKGEGCIVLCYGPPGTGKTLTAESLAETLRRPLWAISAFELGEEAGQLEMRLRQVLNTALRWRAVVLLDEADAYLERRGSNVDIQRNLMTGVFLRLLEYYAGVLFLTTNRVRAFDEAFLSRISLCIRYPSLNDQQRLLIWQTLLMRAGLAASTPVPPTLVQCGHALNGREIRNIIALGHTWAHSRDQPLSLTDVHDALQLVVSGSKELLEDLEA